MRKYLLALCVLGATSLAGSAQLRWGVETGVNISHALETDATKAGFNAGVSAEYSFTDNWFIDASLKLNSLPCGDKANAIFNNPGGESINYGYSATYTPYYLNLPIRAGYKFSLGSDAALSIAAGPAVGVGLFGKTSISYFGLTESTQEVATHRIFSDKSAGCFSSSRFLYGANVRLGIELKKHYTLGFEYSIFHVPGNIKAVDNINSFSINLGYKF